VGFANATCPERPNPRRNVAAPPARVRSICSGSSRLVLLFCAVVDGRIRILEEGMNAEDGDWRERARSVTRAFFETRMLYKKLLLHN